jgi:hypothetical protein
MEHDAGILKQNNLGEDDTMGQIVAGELSKVFYVRPYLNIDATGTHDDAAKSVAKMYYDTERIEFSIDIPEGSEKVQLIVPMLEGYDYDVKVTYRELGGVDVTDTFEPYYDRSGDNYLKKRMTYTPDVPFPSSATYDVVIINKGELPAPV